MQPLKGDRKGFLISKTLQLAETKCPSGGSRSRSNFCETGYLTRPKRFG